MKFRVPMPVCREFIDRITAITGMDVKKSLDETQLVTLIKRQNAKYANFHNGSTIIVSIPKHKKKKKLK